jgi:phosphohistidine phosphatase
MTLYLVRHGKARKGGKDRLRPLTQRGIRETRAAAEFLDRMRIRPTAIWHSNRVRAVETAKILQRLQPRQRLIEQPGLGPADLVGPLVRRIQRSPSELMIVGHLPHLGKLLAKLLGAGKSKELLHFTPSTVVILRREERKWSIDAVLPPTLTAIAPDPALVQTPDARP